MLLVFLHTLSHTYTHMYTHSAGISASLSGCRWDVRWSQWLYQSPAKAMCVCVSVSVCGCDLCLNSSINDGACSQDGPLPIHILGCLATVGLLKRWGDFCGRATPLSHPILFILLSPLYVQTSFSSFDDFLILPFVSTELRCVSVSVCLSFTANWPIENMMLNSVLWGALSGRVI